MMCAGIFRPSVTSHTLLPIGETPGVEEFNLTPIQWWDDSSWLR
jgi:hypothetical protein